MTPAATTRRGRRVRAEAEALPVLLATRDEALLADVLRLAAAAGVTLEVAHDSEAALRSWTAAAVVLIGVDLVPLLATHRPPRHDGVHVVGAGPVADPVFRAALEVGARDVVELPQAEEWLVDLLSDALDGAAAGARTIGVLAGSGGAGASTFAAALGQVSPSATALLDLDPWGPGLGRLLGFDDVDGIRWDALVTASGRLGSRSLLTALPHRDGLSLLTFGPGPAQPLDDASVREVVAAAQRGCDLVAVDLPRTVAGAGPGAEPAAAALARCDHVLVVVHASVSGVASAARVADRLTPQHPDVGLVVRTAPASVPAGDVALALGLPLVTEYPSRRRVVEQVDLGLGPVGGRRGPLARAAREALDRTAPGHP